MIISNKYELLEQIGVGEFGIIYKGRNIRTNEEVAIKTETTNNNISLLKNEANVYQYIGNRTGFPNLKWYGRNNDYYFLVMPLLGDSIEKTIKNNKVYLNAEIKMLATQMIKQIQIIHELNLLHRDIKPANFLFGLGINKSVLHLIDFGFCKQYITSDNKHIPFKTNKSIIGTPSFISTNIHNGNEPSRRDDIESIVYIMIYMQLGYLPWNNIHNTNRIAQYNEIYLAKMNIQNIQNIQNYIIELLDYCRHLRFDETPNYQYIYSVLESK
jgi:serine/threonine protein kinase